MASPPVAQPLAPMWTRGARLAFLPRSLGVVAIIVAATLGHVWAGVLFAGGLLLGAANGMAAQMATVWMATADDVDRRRIVRSSLRRLAVVTVVAIGIAFL